MKAACLRGLDALLGRAGRDRGGVEVVGGDAVGFDAGKTYLVMHIDDPSGLVAHEKGAGLAWMTNRFIPQLIDQQIYSKVADQMRQQFKERGSTVSIDVVQTPPIGKPPTSDLTGGIVLGVLLSALGYGAVKLVGAGVHKAGR